MRFRLPQQPTVVKQFVQQVRDGDMNEKLVWKESEMTEFAKINKSSDNIFVGDATTMAGPFATYLRRKDTSSFRATSEGDIDWNYMNNKSVIWREISAKGIKDKLNINFSNIYDVGDTKVFISK